MTSTNKLSLAEELLLITLDDESGRLLDSIKPFAFEIAVAASLIMELSLKGKIDSDAKKLFVVSSQPTGNAILDEALTEIAAEKNSLSTSDWLNRFARKGDDFSDQIIENLVAKLESKSKFSTSESLKGAVQAYSAKIAYGFKPSRVIAHFTFLPVVIAQRSQEFLGSATK